MKEATKQLANKSQVDAVLDAADKNIEKNKENFKRLISVILR